MKSATETKVDIDRLRKAVRNVFVFKSSPKSEQEDQHTERKDRQILSVNESEALCYKTEKSNPEER